MNKLLVLIFPCLFLLALPSAGASENPALDLESFETPEGTILVFQLNDWKTGDLVIDGDAFALPRIPGEALFMKKGAPALPKVCRSLIIPDDMEMDIRVIDARYHDLPAAIAPSRGSIKRTVMPDQVPYTFGPEYGADAFFPPVAARLGTPYIMRDFRGIVVELHPFQYNPVTGMLRVNTSLTLEVTAKGPGKINVKKPNPRERARSRAFHGFYKHHFLNYNSQTRYNPMDEQGGLLVLCHDAWLSEVQPLVEYKRAVGMDAAAVGVSTVGNGPAAIKAFIHDLYRYNNLAFVLLVGDSEQVATLMKTVGGSLGSVDPDYALLEGNDSYPEIMVGRFSAESAHQVRTQVERTLAYELAPAAGQPWFWKGMGVASDQGPGDDGEMDNEHIDNIRALLMSHGYTEVDQIYDPNANALMVKEGLESGRGILNYCGHGGSGGWGTSSFTIPHVESLTNHSELAFMNTVACSTGHFADNTCIGEIFLRAEHDGKPTGAMAYYGGSISQYWSEPMEAQDEFNQLLVDETYACLGTLLYGGGCSMMDKYPNGGVDMFITWHLFGDPSVRVTGTAPDFDGLVALPFTGLHACGEHKGPFAPEKITYTLTNHGAYSRDFLVYADADWVDIRNISGTLSPGGEREIMILINDSARQLAPGRHEATVTMVDGSDPKKVLIRHLILEVGGPVPIHAFNLEGSPGWQMTGEWQFGRPGGQGAVEHGYPDPASGYSGTNVYGVNLGGDYSITPGGPFYLTTHGINCANLKNTTLRFMRWMNADFQPYFFSTVEVSCNGTDWDLVWENPGVEIAEKTWYLKSYDISHVADGQREVYIRWGYEKGSPAYPYSGWNIDDIEIWGIPLKKKMEGNSF